jgi:hypothetical protein
MCPSLPQEKSDEDEIPVNASGIHVSMDSSGNENGAFNLNLMNF